MPETEGKVDLLCQNCGATFAAFLRHMAEHNQKVICPHCGQEQEPAEAGRAPEAHQ